MTQEEKAELESRMAAVQQAKATEARDRYSLTGGKGLGGFLQNGTAGIGLALDKILGGKLGMEEADRTDSRQYITRLADQTKALNEIADILKGGIPVHDATNAPPGPCRAPQEMSAANSYRRFAFAAIEFPVEDWSIKGGVRHHVHEFPRVPGGAVEKLGRSVYRISCSALMMDTFKLYPGLYPSGLNRLLALFETSTTADLVVRGWRTIPAFCINWDRSFSAKILSGEKVKLEFIEDQSEYFLTENLVAPASRVDTSTADMRAAVAKSRMGETPGTLAQVLDAVDKIDTYVTAMQAAVDAGPLFANLVEAHAERALAQVRVADKLVESTYPENLAFVLAVRAIADLVLRRRNDTLNARVTAATYVVPVDMAVTQIATNLYGSSARGSELVALNGLSDPSRVRAGTPLPYYP
ncbi:hypothetical protein OUZ56_032630, partial [Daphnia magna]